MKASLSAYPLQSDHYHMIDVGCVRFAVTRYSREGMAAVFGTYLLPVISSSDTKLLFRLFQFDHTVVNPSHQHHLGKGHLPLNLTLQVSKLASLLQFVHM